MQRLIEQAAAEMGKDPVALRKLNHIQPGQFPFSAASGSVYDSGDFSTLLEETMERSDPGGYAARVAASKAKGLLRGRGRLDRSVGWGSRRRWGRRRSRRSSRAGR